MPLVLDSEQNFSCRSCAECCRRAFDIVITEAERKRYDDVKAARWFRGDTEAGEAPSPFEAAGHGLIRIQKRADGSCGFLTDEKRCRIHEELGAAAKPLTCQIFPYSFGSIGGVTRVTTSFCCPTVIRNQGRSLAEQEKEIGAAARRWARENEPKDAMLEWVKGKPISSSVLESMRWSFRRILDLHEPTFSLRRNVRRIAALVEDWTRSRVLKLDGERFEDYIKPTGEFAATKPGDPPPVRQRVPRFLFRGLFFSSLVPLVSRSDPKAGSGIALRFRLFKLLLHTHGFSSSFEGVRFGAASSRSLDLDAEPFFAPAYHVLRAAIENLGSGRRPVVDELSLAVAHLLVAETLFLSRETKEDAEGAWIRAIMDAHDVAHSDPTTPFGRVLTLLAAPPAPLHLFGAREATFSA